MINHKTLDDADAQGLTPIALFCIDKDGDLFALNAEEAPTKEQLAGGGHATMLIVKHMLDQLAAGNNPFEPKKAILTPTDIARIRVSGRDIQLKLVK